MASRRPTVTHIANNGIDDDNEQAILDDDELLDLDSSSSSINSSVGSERAAAGVGNTVPLAYLDAQGGGTSTRRRLSSNPGGGISTHRTRSYSSSYKIASQALQTLRHTVSGQSDTSRNDLSKQSTRFSVRDIYGDMADNDVRLRRTATRATILNDLVKRVQSTQASDHNLPISGIPVDEEAKVGSDESETGGPDLGGGGTGLYEQLPDTTVPTKDYGQEFADIDPELVTWDGPDDPEFPRNWSMKQKVFQTFIVSMYTMISPMTSSIPSPAMPEIAASLGMTDNPSLQTFSVSVMILAWALGPLIIAPISESDKIGRRPVLNISVWINFFFNIGCALCQTPAQLCIFRFLGGLGGCASLNVGAGTLADLYDDDERLVAMAFYGICPTLGPVLSPVISGFIIANMNWRWVFYVISIFNGFIAIFGTIFFRETYSPKLLHNKATALKKETGNEFLHTIYEIADGETKWGQFVVTISRPLKLLFTHPMVFGLGSFMAFTYGFMYLMIVTFPTVYEVRYGYAVQIAGLMYLPMGIGYIAGVILFTIGIDKVYHYLTKRNGGVSKPEYRLPFLCFSGFGIPIGLVWYGWSVEKQLHWIMPAIGTGIFAFSFIAVFQTIQNYLIDMNNRFAASSIAAAAVFRSLFGFAFPLFARQMYDRLGYGWGNTLCAIIGFTLGVPFPIFCLKYGERLRNWANNRMEEEQAARDVKNLERLKRLNEDKEKREITRAQGKSSSEANVYKQ